MKWMVETHEKKQKIDLPETFNQPGPWPISLDKKLYFFFYHQEKQQLLIYRDGKPEQVEKLEIKSFILSPLLDSGDRQYTLECRTFGQLRRIQGILYRHCPGIEARVQEKKLRNTTVCSPMAGKILKIFKKQGDLVKPSDVLLTIEAMKMENRIKATTGGIILELAAEPSQKVYLGDVLVKINPN